MIFFSKKAYKHTIFDRLGGGGKKGSSDQPYGDFLKEILFIIFRVLVIPNMRVFRQFLIGCLFSGFANTTLTNLTIRKNVIMNLSPILQLTVLCDET
jgi:hypothetical protein